MTGVAGLTLRRATPDDGALLADFLLGLSPELAYLRFLTGMGGAPSASLISGLLPDGDRRGALLGFVGGRLVGHALWARFGDVGAVEVAVVVGDRHQRRGVGTALARGLAAELSARGIEQVQVTCSAANRAVPRMVAALAPGAVHVLDDAVLTYELLLPRSASLPLTA